MAEISMDAVIGQLLGVLKEAFEGPQRWSYFTDQGPEGAMFGSLSALSAVQASQVVGGTSIAAHVYHTTFGLEASAAWINGDRTPRDWPESWRLSEVDETMWQNLLEEMQASYEELSGAIATHASSSVEAMGGAIGAIAHVAYHLGAIRQKIAISQQR